MKDIYFDSLYYPFINHVVEFFFHEMVIEIVFNFLKIPQINLYFCTLLK
jgi:hypothetical protein